MKKILFAIIATVALATTSCTTYNINSNNASYNANVPAQPRTDTPVQIESTNPGSVIIISGKNGTQINVSNVSSTNSNVAIAQQNIRS